MSEKNTTDVAEAVKPQGATKQSKEHETIEQEYLATGHVKLGYTLHYETVSGETRVIIEKV